MRPQSSAIRRVLPAVWHEALGECATQAQRAERREAILCLISVAVWRLDSRTGTVFPPPYPPPNASPLNRLRAAVDNRSTHIRKSSAIWHRARIFPLVIERESER